MTHQDYIACKKALQKAVLNSEQDPEYYIYVIEFYFNALNEYKKRIHPRVAQLIDENLILR